MSLFSSRKNPATASEIIPEHTHANHPTTHDEEKKENPLTEILRFSLIALIIVIPIRMFVAQPFIVSGASMEETFHSGEYLIVDQLTYDFHKPSRGDVIVFRYPRDPSKFFIKRVIGLPGDTINIDGSTVRITNKEFPNGKILNEPYIKSMAAGGITNEVLGDREYFVMGDNRDQSSDSRVWGVLQEERIIGRVYLRLFPPNVASYLPGEVAANVITNSP